MNLRVWIPPYIQTTKKTLLSFKSLIVAKVCLNSVTAGSGDFASQSDWHSVIKMKINPIIFCNLLTYLYLCIRNYKTP